jgi:hypothetical protein
MWLIYTKETCVDNLQTLSESKPRRTAKVVRNEKAYSQCAETTVFELTRLVDIYKNTVFEEDMRARLYRDSMEKWIRRYHEYSIRGNFKSHYHQRGVSLNNSDVTFEHVIPVRQLLYYLLSGEMTIIQVLNAPTCRVSNASNKLLNDRGMHETNTDPWLFFKRYAVGCAVNGQSIEVETYNGQVITDLTTWTLRDHYNFFGVV